MINWLLMKTVAATVTIDTAVLPDNWDIEAILKIILNVLVYGMGAAAVFGVVVAGILYMTAGDDPAKVARAKKLLIEIVIGLVAWALMFTVLNWLIPGGIAITNT